MTIYEETIAAFKTFSTCSQHITRLAKTMNKTEDPQLNILLGAVIRSLQKMFFMQTRRVIPFQLYESTAAEVRAVTAYCETLIVPKRQEWEVLAERNGWGPIA